MYSLKTCNEFGYLLSVLRKKTKCWSVGSTSVNIIRKTKTQ